MCIRDRGFATLPGGLGLFLAVGMPACLNTVQLAVDVCLLRPLAAIFAPTYPLTIGPAIDVLTGSEPVSILVVKGPDTLLFAVDELPLD